MTSLIQQWHPLSTPDEPRLYAILDSLHLPNPVPLWYERAWGHQGVPLYYQTPLESMLSASPWLFELAPSMLAEIDQWIATQPKADWGWLYLSHRPWQQQIEHWHHHLRIVIDGQLRAVRFQDPRVLSLWLDIDDCSIWQRLLGPVKSLQLSGAPIVHRPGLVMPISSELPWRLPSQLSDAWHQSPFGIKVTASNLEMNLWEQSPQLAESIYRKKGQIEVLLSAWLTERINAGSHIRNITLDDVIAWSKHSL